MWLDALRGGFNPLDIIRVLGYKIKFKKENPLYFDPFGTLVFCGSQGSGKTLSAVRYCNKLLNDFPYAVFNITNRPFNARLVATDDELEPFVVVSDVDGQRVTEETIISKQHKYVTVEYDGLDSLKFINNGKQGVLFFIDELHLEMNSLESKNIDIDVMTEISQQRKHIVGSSQVFMRLAKPLREQIKNVVLCKCFFGLVQWNKLIDGETAVERDGKLECEVKKRVLWTHFPELYEEYDTYAKMKRYRDEWQGRPRINIYQDEKEIEVRRA